jgi:putative tricarboxylic transport membrane protein
VTGPAGAGGMAGPRPAVAAGVGIALLALAALVFFDALDLPPGSVRGVGPAAAMRLVAALLALLGIAHLVTALRNRRPPAAAAGAEPPNRQALAWVLGALAGLMLILQAGGGFIVAAAWLFALTARGFGEPLGVRSIGLGATLSAVVYFFFTKVLSLGLPAGPLERLVS